MDEDKEEPTLLLKEIIKLELPNPKVPITLTQYIYNYIGSFHIGN